jgi:hypothetical protein
MHSVGMIQFSLIGNSIPLEIQQFYWIVFLRFNFTQSQPGEVSEHGAYLWFALLSHAKGQ